LRIGEFKSLLTGRSFCPACKKNLKARDLIPLASFLLLRGKCRFCHKQISVHYFWVELVAAAVFVLVATFGACGTAPLLWNLFFASILIFLASFDAQFGEIPDEVSLPAIFLALLGSVLVFTPSPATAIIGMLVGGGFFAALVLISNGRWMGGGDIRLGLLIGALVGWRGFAVALFIAALIGSVFGVIQILRQKKKLRSALPFAPFLASGGILAMLFTEKVWAWYLTWLLPN
ncbi:MAG: A24 family peptidase, partial [Candidatus Peribacteraceae bacterium]|nr:A24 family peptidase [Candidatus Peribacteraceae bacterium]